jgi:hypothetical protein
LNQVNLNLEKVVKKVAPKVAAAPPIGMKKAASGRGNTKPAKKRSSGDLFADDEPQYKAPRPAPASLPGPGDLPSATVSPTVPMTPFAPPPVAQNTGAVTIQQPAVGAAPSVVVVPISPSGYAQPMMPAYPYGSPYGSPYGGGGGYGSPYPAPGYSGYPPMGYGGDQQAPMAPAPPPAPDYYGNSRTKKKTKARKPRPPFVLMLLPLGIPQMTNGDYVLGVLAAGGQVASLYWYYDNNRSAAAAYADAKKVNSDPSYTTEQDKLNQAEYLKRMNTYVKQKESASKMGIYGFGAFYAVSVIEGIVSYYGPNKPATASLGLPPNDALGRDEEAGLDEAQEIAVQQKSPLRLDLGLLLTPDGADAAPAFILDYRF